MTSAFHAVADLAEELEERDIRLLVYLPSGAPAADPEARKRLRWRWGQTGGWQLPGEPVGDRAGDRKQRQDRDQEPHLLRREGPEDEVEAGGGEATQLSRIFM